VNSPLLATAPANTFGTTATSAPSSLNTQALLPLAFWFGFDEPRKSPALVQRRIRELGEHVNERLRNDPFGEVASIALGFNLTDG
jgi:polyribonucleotide 5'-hydroxyl-kinase